MAAKNEEEAVRKAPLFTALDDASATSLRASMNGVKLSRGQVLFKEGDAGDQLFVVVAVSYTHLTLPTKRIV